MDLPAQTGIASASLVRKDSVTPVERLYSPRENPLFALLAWYYLVGAAISALPACCGAITATSTPTSASWYGWSRILAGQQPGRIFRYRPLAAEPGQPRAHLLRLRRPAGDRCALCGRRSFDTVGWQEVLAVGRGLSALLDLLTVCWCS
jgi:hypothetical protein